MNIEEVKPTLTFINDYKTGEMLPKMRTIALRKIKAQRERGMPRDLNAYEIGVNICVNGRHFAYIGTTVGAPKGKRVIDAKGVYQIIARAMLPYLQGEAALPLTENDYQLFLSVTGSCDYGKRNQV